MVRFSFKRGLRFFKGFRRWTLDKVNAVGQLVFESQDEQCERVARSTEEVYELWLSGEWTIDIDSLGPGANHVWHSTPIDLGSLPPDQRAVAQARVKLLTALRAHFQETTGPIKCNPREITAWLGSEASKFGFEKAPHWSTVWRWWKRFARTQCATRLVNAPRTGRRIDSTQHAIFLEVVDEVYLRDQKVPGKNVVDEVDRRYLALNRGQPTDRVLPKPSPATIYRWLSKLHYSVVSAARNGKEFAQREFREVVGQVEVHRILERYEVDHTPVDVQLICERTFMVLGKPWLTLIIDRYSRMVAGFYVSFHAPSASSVLYALRQAILPKTLLIQSVPDVLNPWPLFGCPLKIFADNGMELHADALEAFCLEALIELGFAGVAHPEMKGAIERLFGTLSRDLFHQLPGTVFANIEQRGDYPSEQRAALTLKVFTQVLVRWIVDVYHCTPHKGLLGHTPLNVCTAQLSTVFFDLPAFPRQLDLMVGHATTRTIFHYGVEYDNVQYSSSRLLAMRDPHAKRPVVAIKVYEEDIGYIDVLDDEVGEYLRVPAIDLTYAEGLNRNVHSVIRAEVRRRFKDQETREHLLAVKAEIQAIVQAAILDKKAGVRKRAASLRLEDSEAMLGTRPAKALATAISPKAIDDEAELELFGDDTDELPSFQILSNKATS